MEFKTDALVLRAADYGENDKIVTLLTADRGKISAGLKGVKKAGAKLKFASQPFCFAEFLLAPRGGRNTVVSASLYDGFYSLREDVVPYYAATCVLEACDRLVYEQSESGAFLVAALKALREMEGENCAGALLTFLLRAFALAGYPVVAGECASCGKPLSGRRNFDFSLGAFTCADCAGVPASESTYLAVRAAMGQGGEWTADGVTRALRLLRAYIAEKAETDLPTLGEFLAL